jgi:hypothetical protein
MTHRFLQSFVANRNQVIQWLPLAKAWEVSMVAPNAREVLKKENELLDELANRAAMFASKATGLEADIYKAWEQDFRRRRESNEELIGASDSDFDQSLTEEINILESLRNSITGNSVVAENWREDLDEDIALSKKVL